MINSLIYASYQIPRILLIAHMMWFDFQFLPNLSDKVAPLQAYDKEAVKYYTEAAITAENIQKK